LRPEKIAIALITTALRKRVKAIHRQLDGASTGRRLILGLQGQTKWNLDLFNVKAEKEKYINLRNFLAYGMNSLDSGKVRRGGRAAIGRT